MRKGWLKVTLSDVCLKIQDGAHHSPKNLYEKGGEGRFLYITSKNIRNNYVDLTKISYVDSNFHDSIYSRCTPELGDVLLTKDGVNTGNVTLNTIKEPFSLLSSVCLIKTDPEKLISPFLVYYIQSKSGFEQMTGRMTGAAIKRIILRTIKKSMIPLPSLFEQKRIVAILDEVFAGIDDAIANTEKNLTNARELFESYLNAVFLNGGNSWIERKLGDTEFLQIIDGDRGKNYPKKSDFLVEGHCLFLNTKNVRPDGFDFETTMFITEEKDAALRKGKLSRRDVILTTRGTIGNIAIYDSSVEYDHIRINSGMLILRPNEKVIISEFLFEMLRSSIVRVQIEQRTSGAAQPQLPIKTLVDFTVPVPKELNEQSRIVLALNEIHSEVQRLEAIYQQKLTALNELKQSILQKAFTGELTADTASQAEKAKADIAA